MMIEVVVYVKDGGTDFKVVRKFVSVPDDDRTLETRLHELDVTLVQACGLEKTT